MDGDAAGAVGGQFDFADVYADSKRRRRPRTAGRPTAHVAATAGKAAER
jgi:hypothetical protein